MNDKTYNNLKPKQKDFIHLLADSTRMGSISPTTAVLSRAMLKGVANDNGIAWAPAWIVKDVSRVTTRGLYRIPELADYRAIGGNIALPEEPTVALADELTMDATPVEDLVTA